MSRVYDPEDLPPGLSWLYNLNTEDLRLQCEVLGIPTTTSAARVNRPLLSTFLKSLSKYGGTLPTPTNHRPDLDIKSRPIGPLPTDMFEELSLNNVLNNCASGQPPLPPSISTVTNLDSGSGHGVTLTTAGSSLASLGSPPATAVSLAPAASLSGSRPLMQAALTQTSPSIHQPVSHPLTSLPLPHPATQPVQQSTPGWQDMIQATAVAVATQVAATMAQCQQVVPSSTSQTPPHILSSLISNLPQTSGSDSKVLVQFLTSIGKLADMNLTSNQNLVISCLPKTTGQLRSLWSQAVADRTPMDVLIHGVLDYFIPPQLRHSLVSTMVYRAQTESEPLPEFVESIQECAALLAPHLLDSDLLEVVVNGLNTTTRAQCAMFPTPTSLNDLLSLVPRLQVVRNLQGMPSTPAPSHPLRSAQPHPPPPSQTQQRPDPRPFSPSQHQSRPHHNSYRHPSQSPNQQGPNNRPYIPRFPFGNSRPYTPRTSPYQPRTFYPAPRTPEQLNRRGGRL